MELFGSQMAGFGMIAMGGAAVATSFVPKAMQFVQVDSAVSMVGGVGMVGAGSILAMLGK